MKGQQSKQQMEQANADRGAGLTLTRRQLLRAAGLAAGGLALAGVSPLGVGTASAAALHTYLDNYPKNFTAWPFGGETNWTEEIQGVTHDAGNWFFSQKWALWKFPVDFNLAQPLGSVDQYPGIRRAGMPDVLADKGYDHFGDIDYYRGYIFAPIQGPVIDGRSSTFNGFTIKPLDPGIAVFRASDLRYVGYARLPDQYEACWCAVHPTTGMLHCTNSDATRDTSVGPTGTGKIAKLFRYAVDFAQLAAGRVILQRQTDLRLFDESWWGITSMPHCQGAAFHPNGKRLYLLNGYLDDATDETREGIQVFDAVGNSWQRVARSTNGYGDFNYEYHTDDDEEPEGITYWDLDDGRAPGIRGVLHALMLDNDGYGSADDLYFKHYR
jgi:hypothetical protein